MKLLRRLVGVVTRSIVSTMSVEDRAIEVVAIGPRRYVYEETYRRVQREND